MAGKHVSIKNPHIKKEKKTTTEDSWVNHRDGTKRLTIDVSCTLHKRLKVASAKQDKSMGDIVRSCIEDFLNIESGS